MDIRALARRLDLMLRPRPVAAPPPGRRISTPLGSVYIREAPSSVGPRLLFAVDGPNVLAHYDGLLAELAGRADVVVFEPPGTGGSWPAPSFDFRLSSFAEVAAHVLAEVGPRTLVFPCYLGGAAIALARRSPHLVPRLVLPQSTSAADLARWADRVDPRRALRTPGLGQVLVAARRRSIARGWYRASVGQEACRPPFAAIADEALRAGGCFCLASLMQALERDAPASDELRVAPVPAAVVWGAADRTHRRSDPTRALRGADVIRFEGSGHCPELEEPARFASWLLAWHGGQA